MLGVPDALIEAHGAVSEPVVAAMASGALQRSGASIAIAVSGIAAVSYTHLTLPTILLV